MATAKNTEQLAEPNEGVTEVENVVIAESASVAPRRFFTIPGRGPVRRDRVGAPRRAYPRQDGPAFEQRNVEFPKFWSQTATNIVAQKYFRGRLSSPSASAA